MGSSIFRFRAAPSVLVLVSLATISPAWGQAAPDTTAPSSPAPGKTKPKSKPKAGTKAQAPKTDASAPNGTAVAAGTSATISAPVVAMAPQAPQAAPPPPPPPPPPSWSDVPTTSFSGTQLVPAGGNAEGPVTIPGQAVATSVSPTSEDLEQRVDSL